jgi:hypothetical protein
VHKTANVLHYLPKSIRARAKAALHEIWMAETKANAQTACDIRGARLLSTHSGESQTRGAAWPSNDDVSIDAIV